MTRLLACLSLLLLNACADTTPIANVGLSLGANGVSVSPGVGLRSGNATLVVRP